MRRREHAGASEFREFLTCGVFEGGVEQRRPGEAKLVIVVDDAVDVFDESHVMRAVATRMQADRDLSPSAAASGLDPSADDRGVTAKLGIDATRPFGEPSARSW